MQQRENNLSSIRNWSISDSRIRLCENSASAITVPMMSDTAAVRVQKDISSTGLIMSVLLELNKNRIVIPIHVVCVCVCVVFKNPRKF